LLPYILVRHLRWSRRLYLNSSRNMYLLPCPQCEKSLQVAPAKAGGLLACPACQASVQVPKLGELKSLPLADDAAEPSAAVKNSREMTVFARALFLVSGLTAIVCLLVASFCGIRWAMLPVPNSTVGHIESTRADMKSFTAAELIRAYEEMEKTPIDLVLPYVYKTNENIRNRWGKNALYSGSAGFLAVALAAFFATTGRKRAQ